MFLKTFNFLENVVLVPSTLLLEYQILNCVPGFTCRTITYWCSVDSWLFLCFCLHFCFHSYFWAYPGSPLQRGAEGDVAVCKSSGYKDLRRSILMILSIAITKRHELDCHELFCQKWLLFQLYFEPRYFHSFTEAHLSGKLILCSVMSHAKIAT